MTTNIEAIREAVERLRPRGVAVLAVEDYDAMLRAAHEEGQAELAAQLLKLIEQLQDRMVSLPANWTEQKRVATVDALRHCVERLQDVVGARLDADAPTMQGGLPAGRVVDLAADESKARFARIPVDELEALRFQLREAEARLKAKEADFRNAERTWQAKMEAAEAIHQEARSVHHEAQGRWTRRIKELEQRLHAVEHIAAGGEYKHMGRD